ncbi:DUF3592 domain-containing protein [Roseivivax sp. CAU 1753]
MAAHWRCPMDKPVRSKPGEAGGDAGQLSLERGVILAMPFILAMLYGFWTYHSTGSYYGDLDALGVETQATIISKRIRRGGGDRPRHAYDMTVGFSVGDTMRRGTVTVTRAFYDSHDPPDRVAIRYLPDDPQIREIDPAMRGKSMRGALTIIGILLFIGVANLFMTGAATRGLRRRMKEQG